MEDILHIRIKKAYATETIIQLLEDDAIEEIQIEPIFSDERLDLIRTERQKYLAKDTPSHTWDDVKKMAMSKQRLNGI